MKRLLRIWPIESLITKLVISYGSALVDIGYKQEGVAVLMAVRSYSSGELKRIKSAIKKTQKG